MIDTTALPTRPRDSNKHAYDPGDSCRRSGAFEAAAPHNEIGSVMHLSEDRRYHIAMLALRAGLGLTMLFAHGLGKISGGPEKWERLGGAGVGWLGIDFGLVGFGLFASLSESVFALLVALGLFTRSTAICVAMTMFFAMMSHLMGGDPFRRCAHALELRLCFSVIAMMGPGRYSIDSWFAARKNKAS